MTSINLKTLQKYRYTIFILIFLFGIAITVAVLSNIPTAKTPPLLPSASILKSNQSELLFDWGKLRLGMNSKECETILGLPDEKNLSNETLLYQYTANPKTPLVKHEVVFKDDKIVRITRNIDSHNQTVSVKQYIDSYGQPDIIQSQFEAGVPNVLVFKNQEGYIILESNSDNTKVYQISLITKDHLPVFKKQLEELYTESDSGFAPEP